MSPATRQCTARAAHAPDRHHLHASRAQMDTTKLTDVCRSGRLRPFPARAARLQAALYSRKPTDTPFWTTPRPTGLDDTDAAAPYARRQLPGRARRQYDSDHLCVRHQAPDLRLNAWTLTPRPPCPLDARGATPMVAMPWSSAPHARYKKGPPLTQLSTPPHSPPLSDRASLVPRPNSSRSHRSEDRSAAGVEHPRAGAAGHLRRCRGHRSTPLPRPVRLPASPTPAEPPVSPRRPPSAS